MSNEKNDINAENERRSLLDSLNDDIHEEVTGEHDSFHSDAEEGLKHLSNEKTDIIVSQLNASLSKKLKKNKYRRADRMAVKPDIYIVIITVLLLIIISWIVLNRMQ